MDFVFDIETDGFAATKIHCLSVSNPEGQIVTTRSYDAMREFFQRPDAWFVGHNVMAFDIPVLERILDTTIDRDRVVDTLYLSRYLFPNRVEHSLESYDPSGKVAVEADEWKEMSFERAKERCEADVRINLDVWKRSKAKLLDIYSKADKCKYAIRYLMFKAKCAAEAELNGWTLDVPRAKQNLEVLTTMRDERYEKLKAEMPTVPVYSVVNQPKVLFKKDGSLSAAGERWYIKCKEIGADPETSERINYPSGVNEPNPGSPQQVKDWLFSLGWKPDEFKYSKAGNKVPQINTLDASRKGEVSRSVEALAEHAPEAIAALSDLSILKHRVGILEAFLSSVREDGRIGPRMGGLTNTLRFAHAGAICNLPGAGTKFGEYVRPCLIAGKGKKLVGADISSLEDMTKRHYMWKWDKSYVLTMQHAGFDPHLDLAIQAGVLNEEDLKKWNSGEDHERIKPIRTKFKTTNYACTYGASSSRVADAAGVSSDEGTFLHTAYWKRNWSIRSIANSTTVQSTKSDDLQWQYNPVSKLWYELRHDKDRFSTLNQGTGSFIFDCWLGYVLTALKGRAILIAQFHDEFILEVDENEDETYLNKTVRNCMDQVNSFLKLNVDLTCDVQFGHNYGEIH